MKNESRLHAVFGLLFVLSFFVSDWMREVLASWSEPRVGLLSLVVALTWTVSFFLLRGRELDEELRALRARVERAERKIGELERHEGG